MASMTGRIPPYVGEIVHYRNPEDDAPNPCRAAIVLGSGIRVDDDTVLMGLQMFPANMVESVGLRRVVDVVGDRWHRPVECEGYTYALAVDSTLRQANVPYKQLRDEGVA